MSTQIISSNENKPTPNNIEQLEIEQTEMNLLSKINLNKNDQIKTETENISKLPDNSEETSPKDSLIHNKQSFNNNQNEINELPQVNSSTINPNNIFRYPGAFSLNNYGQLSEINYFHQQFFSLNQNPNFNPGMFTPNNFNKNTLDYYPQQNANFNMINPLYYNKSYTQHESSRFPFDSFKTTSRTNNIPQTPQTNSFSSTQNLQNNDLSSSYEQINQMQMKKSQNSNKSRLACNNMNNLSSYNNNNNAIVSLDDLWKDITKNNQAPTEFIKTQKGSREVQKFLYKVLPNEITILIQRLSESLPELMTDKYGNYFCQKLIQNCSPEQRIEILKSVQNNFCEISCNSFGTHSLQVLVEIANMENEQELLCSCIEKCLIQLSCNQRGTHIVQKFISNCTRESLQRKLYLIIIDNFLNLVNNPHGVCVLIKTLKFGMCKEEKINLLKLIIKNGLEIIQNPFGNYVVQTLLNDYFEKENDCCMKLLSIINENFFSLSMQKFSSNVVENSLRLNNKEILKQNLLNVIVSGKIGSMLKNTYGNFILEKLISRLSNEDKEEIAEIIETNCKDKNSAIFIKLISEQ